MLSKLANRIKTQTFPNGKALIAVSGGVDSMVLWALCRELNIPHVIAHFNFQLRANESDLDQAFIERIAQAHQSELFLSVVSANDYAAQHKLSIQESARELRYQWFNQLIDEGKADYLMTAHHLDDSLETFLINLNRGTGLKGLGGIQNRDKVYRPLLNCSKDQLVDYAIQQKVEYREDSSNEKDDYLRNWFRHHLIPDWKAKNPQLLERMQKNFQRFHEAQEMVDHYLSQEIEKRLSNNDLPQEFELTELDQFPFPQALLRSWLSKFGFNSDQVAQIWQSAQAGRSGAFFYSNAFRLLIDRKKLILDQIDPSHLREIDLDAPGLIKLPTIQLNIEEVGIEHLDYESEQLEFFDADKLVFPLKFRPWESGDRMQPLGMSGQKKISDILIDDKVDRFDKELSYVMLSKAEVAWLLGQRISEAFKVDASTKKLIRIAWSKH